MSPTSTPTRVEVVRLKSTPDRALVLDVAPAGHAPPAAVPATG